MTVTIHRHNGTEYDKVATFEDGEVVSGEEEIPRTANAIRGMGEEEVVELLDSFKLLAVKEIESEKMEKVAYHLWDNTPELSDEGDLEILEQYLYDAYEQQIHPWDLTKAPRMWASDDEVPDFVEGWIEDVIEMVDPMWDQGFDDVPHAAQLQVHGVIKDSLTQSQGWSTASIANRLQDEFEWMGQDHAEKIARQEVAAILNKAREVAYRARSDFEQMVFDWVGPDDAHTTQICTEIKEEIEDRGGAVTMDQLKDVLREKAREYRDRGGTPARVEEGVPHFQCRHTYVKRELDEVR